MERELVKIAEAAERIGKSKQIVRMWAKRGSVYSEEQHGLILVDPDEVARYSATDRPAGRPKGSAGRKPAPGLLTPDLYEQFREAKERTGDTDDVALADAIQGYVDRANRRKKK